MKKLNLNLLAILITLLSSNLIQAQWDPTWYPVPNWNNTPASSTPNMPDATPWALGGNQIIAPVSYNGHYNYSCGTMDGSDFALKASGIDCIYMDQFQRVAIGPNHMPSVSGCQLDIRGSGSNFRIFGNTNGDVESTSNLRLYYDNLNTPGTSDFEIRQGSVGTSNQVFHINGNGYTTIQQDLRVGGQMWASGARINVDGRLKSGVVIAADNGNVGMNICNQSGVGKFLVRINAGGGDNAEFRLVGRTQIGFYQTPGWIIDPSTMVNVDAYATHGVKVTTNNTIKKMFYVDYNSITTFEVRGDGKTNIGAGRPLSTGVAATAMLSVDGMILAKDIRVAISTQTHWADYVFEKNYKLMPLAEVEQYVSKNKHLPGVPSEAEVKEEGVDLVDMNVKLLQKVEELFLHTIELKKQNENLERQIEKLNTEVKSISK